MGTGELVINLHENETRIYDADDTTKFRKLSPATITGIYSKPFVIDSQEQFSVIGVHFKPGGLFPFFAFPITELENTTESLDDIWGKSIQELRDQLLEAPTATDRLKLLEKYLLGRLVKEPTHHCAVTYAMEKLGSQSVGEVFERTGYSQRRFIEVFSNQVGVTPKTFYRILRFQKVIQKAHEKKNTRWLDIALDSGFFDQAHFIRDFKEFSKMSPTQFLGRMGDHLNHVPLT